VWIGYDNADGKRRTLGGGATGGHVAVPIFEPVIQAVWASVAPKAALAPPSQEAKRQLTCKSMDLESGEIQNGRGKPITECLRVDAKGRVLDTQYRLVSRSDVSGTGWVKENRTRPSNKIAKPAFQKPALPNQVPSEYNPLYGWDNNGRYTYQPNFWGGAPQSSPQLPRAGRQQQANPFWSYRY
jgi:membrane carboxypeptidase/penicillin-binding protein